MKTTIIITALLSFATIGSNAQSAKTSCQRPADMPANAVMVYPRSAYTPLGDPACPPCYQYTTKRGLQVMECPYATFNADQTPSVTPIPLVTTQNGNNSTIDVLSQNTYTGNYPVCKRDPDMPANAWLVWPKTAYKSNGNPACAPCYEYKSKNGILVMECPDVTFLPENK